MNWVIVTPHYDAKSNGILMLFKLGQVMAKLGETIYYYPHSVEELNSFRHLLAADVRMRMMPDLEIPADSIFIVNDTTPAHVLSKLNAYRKVWYLLNKPLFIERRPIHVCPDDFIVAYSKFISTCYFNLFINMPLASPPTPLPHSERENKITFYVGKGFVDKPVLAELLKIARRKGCVLAHITRREPECKKMLYSMMRTSRLLVSFDPITNVTYEAVMNGTPVFSAAGKGFLDYKDHNVAMEGVFTNIDLVTHYLENGLSMDEQEKNLRQYHESLAESTVVVKEFIKRAEIWFEGCRQGGGDKFLGCFTDEYSRVRELLAKHNMEVPALDSESIRATNGSFHEMLQAHNANRQQLMLAEYSTYGARCSGHLSKPYKNSRSKAWYKIVRFCIMKLCTQDKTERYLRLSLLDQAHRN